MKCRNELSVRGDEVEQITYTRTSDPGAGPSLPQPAFSLASILLPPTLNKGRECSKNFQKHCALRFTMQHYLKSCTTAYFVQHRTVY